MRSVIQRVNSASVSINLKVHACIGKGLLVLLGVEETDTDEDIEWLAGKIARLRIFNDEHGQMNLSLEETGGELLVISQFTLYASTRKGNRPSYIRAAKPEKAIPIYERTIKKLQEISNTLVKTGVFGADMKVSLVNDGPVTIIIDTKNRE